MPKRKVLTKKVHCLPDIWGYLNDEDLPADGWTFDIFDLCGDPEKEETLWKEYRDEILETWIKSKPGTRPSLWWAYNSPKQPDTGSGWFFEGKLPELRRAENDEELDETIWSYLGVPVCNYSEEIYFESQASYLKRHNLLTPAEKRILTEKDFSKAEALSQILAERLRIKPY
jgi:hypothetical protein